MPQARTLHTILLLMRKLTFLTLLPLYFCQAQTDSCTIVWDPIKQISFDTAYSVAPQVIAEGDAIHVLWFNPYVVPSPDSLLGIFYSHSFDGGKIFSPPRQLFSLDSARGNPGRLAVSGEFIYLLYLSPPEPPWSYPDIMAIMRSTDAGMSWEPKKLLGDLTPRAITAHDSSVYIRYSYDDTTGGEHHFYSGCMVSHDFGVTFETVGLGLPPYPGDGSNGMNTLAYLANSLHYVYSKGVGSGGVGSYEILYSLSTDFGRTWIVPDTLSVKDTIDSVWPRIAGDDEGNVYVVWYDGKYGSIDGFHGTVIMRKSSNNGLIWGPEVVLTSTPTAYIPSIDASVDGYVLVVWQEYVDYYRDRSLLRTSTDFGNTWCDTVSVSTEGTVVTSFLISRNSVHSALTDIREVYYRRGQLPLFAQPVPNTALLFNCYPNPFNTGTVIQYELSMRDKVDLDIYDVLGRRVATLMSDETKEPGRYEVRFQPDNLASGVFFYRLKTTTYQETKKLIFMK